MLAVCVPPRTRAEADAGCVRGAGLEPRAEPGSAPLCRPGLGSPSRSAVPAPSWAGRSAELCKSPHRGKWRERNRWCWLGAWFILLLVWLFWYEADFCWDRSLWRRPSQLLRLSRLVYLLLNYT